MVVSLNSRLESNQEEKKKVPHVLGNVVRKVPLERARVRDVTPAQLKLGFMVEG